MGPSAGRGVLVWASCELCWSCEDLKGKMRGRHGPPAQRHGGLQGARGPKGWKSAFKTVLGVGDMEGKPLLLPS